MNKRSKGLTEEEVLRSRQKYGSNVLEKQKKKGFFGKFIENLSDPIIRVLLIAVAAEVIITFKNCNWFEVGGIIAAVLIATTVSTVSEYGSEKAFARMQESESMSRVRVIRDGVFKEVRSDELVVGDVIQVSAGEQVPADAKLIDGRLTLDQSALNGESREVNKFSDSKEKSNGLDSHSALHKGSIVCSGSGIAEVFGVGKSTYYGMVAKDVQSETRESPLKLRLGKLAHQISLLGYFMAFLVGLTYLFFSFVVDNGFSPERIAESFKNVSFVAATLAHTLTLMITVVVVAVPEGLPMMITVVLSANMKRMLSDNIMVKKLVGIETAGSMNLLFTDKTGTLTTGKTTVDKILTAGSEYKSPVSLRATGDIYKYLKISADYGIPEGSEGNSTDKALTAFFSSERQEKVNVRQREDFTSEKKYSSVSIDTNVTVYKGAPEYIIDTCDSVLLENGAKRSIDKTAILEKYRKCSTKGERVIAFALKDGNGIAFLALAVLRDKLRPGVRAEVERLHAAGVSVVMITGDSPETAKAIAAECGILRSERDESVITHSDMEKLSDDELMRVIPKLRVVARALPQDKSRLVRLSQQLELVVGMTGDGINDAPSLKLADVGFSMGSGTDIAKGASDVVILDDSLSAIAKTVLYGRTIFKSIRKFISFQLMMNIIACGVSLVGQFIGIDNPITIIQMLWVNIIMDTLGGLAFAGEPALDYYMMELPKKREEPILTRDMLHQILITGAFSLGVCIAFLKLDFFASLFRSEDNVFLTAFYALFIFMGIFNCFNTRSERLSLLSNIGRNRAFLIIMLMIAAVQTVMIYFGGELFRSVPLSIRELLNVILIASCVIPFDMVRRIVKKLN